MKIQYKISLIISLVGIVIVILLSLGYDHYTYEIVLNEQTKNIKSLADEVTMHLESHLNEEIAIATTLSSAPIIRNSLRKSNAEFYELPDPERKQKIDQLNQKWMITKDVNDPFILSHMENPVAEYLANQQKVFPGAYGEIFLTNRYGVMIATTGKLTTLSHAHKYWWLACYNDGKGKVFLDDRGFDESVQGYVLGVVIPIMDKNELIGILKCNVNIMGRLTNIIEDFIILHSGKIHVVRTSGFVVAESGVVPLSKQINDHIIKAIKMKSRNTAILTQGNSDDIVAYSSIPITMGSKQVSFGGSRDSIDHIKGNEGDAWHIVITLGKDKINEVTHRLTLGIFMVGLALTILITAVAMLIGRWIAKPIVQLTHTAQEIGNGHLSVRSDIHSGDEIGTMAKSLNLMTENLQETMISRDKLEKTNQELQVALDNVKTLSGLVPICASCKKIRDDKGYWNQIELYLESHTSALFSHSLCSECEEKYYKDEEWYKKSKEASQPSEEKE